jgi:hypothetical protein
MTHPRIKVSYLGKRQVLWIKETMMELEWWTAMTIQIQGVEPEKQLDMATLLLNQREQEMSVFNNQIWLLKWIRLLSHRGSLLCQTLSLRYSRTWQLHCHNSMHNRCNKMNQETQTFHFKITMQIEFNSIRPITEDLLSLRD